MPELQPSLSCPILTSQLRNWLKKMASAERDWQGLQHYRALHPASLRPLSKVASRHRWMLAHFFRLNSRLTGKASVWRLVFPSLKSQLQSENLPPETGLILARQLNSIWRSLDCSPCYWTARSTQYCGAPSASSAKLQNVWDTQDCLVRPRRLELPRAFAHNDLNVARLPIPPWPHLPRQVGARH